MTAAAMNAGRRMLHARRVRQAQVDSALQPLVQRSARVVPRLRLICDVLLHSARELIERAGVRCYAGGLGQYQIRSDIRRARCDRCGYAQLWEGKQYGQCQRVQGAAAERASDRASRRWRSAFSYVRVPLGCRADNRSVENRINQRKHRAPVYLHRAFIVCSADVRRRFRIRPDAGQRCPTDRALCNRSDALWPIFVLAIHLFSFVSYCYC